jgi:hypothetical protein
MTWRKRVGILALLFAGCALPRLASAQPHAPTAQELETARTLYKGGKELRAKGDLRGALEKFQAAHALGNTPVTGIELARTSALVGQIVEARETCLSIARMPVAGDETEKSAEARAEAAKLAEELRPRIPTLFVQIAGLATGERARLLIDDVGVPEAAQSEPQKVDPGRHEVVARVGEGKAARQVRGAAEVKEGESRELTLTLPPPLPAAPAEKEQETAPAPRGMSTLGKLSVGTAVAGATLGVVAGISAMNKKNQLTTECPGMVCTNESGAADDLSAARRWATVANVSFVVAGVGLAAALVSLWSGSGGESAPPARATSSATPWVGLGMAGVHGHF